jgi:hypothetical protein
LIHQKIFLFSGKSGNNHTSMIVSEQNRQEPVSTGYQCDGFTIFRRKDGIIQVEFSGGYNISLADAQKQIGIFRQMQQGDKCLLLAIFKEDTTFGKDVREFISGDEVSGVIKADALVIRGLALKILTNGYLRINKPNRPCRVFNNTTNALKWLHNYL